MLQVDYATQIFRMAGLFSDPPTSFAMYWTDLSYDNFAVDKEGKVRIVDAENIVVVDKWKLKMGENKMKLVFSKCFPSGFWVFLTFKYRVKKCTNSC